MGVSAAKVGVPLESSWPQDQNLMYAPKNFRTPFAREAAEDGAGL